MKATVKQLMDSHTIMKATVKQLMDSYAMMYERWEYIDFMGCIILPTLNKRAIELSEKETILYKEIYRHFQKGIFSAWKYLKEKERKQFIWWLERYIGDVWDINQKKFEVIRVMENVNKRGIKIELNDRDGQLWNKYDPFRLWLSKDKEGQRLIENNIERQI